MPPDLARTCVIGTTGVGKSTFAARLAEIVGTRAVELDALHWGPNWTATPADEFRRRVAKAVAGERWVVVGNYADTLDLRLARATTAVWLDLPARVAFPRLLRRTVRRVATGEDLWGTGNRETLWTQLGPDSILLWFCRTFGANRRRFGAVMDDPAHAGVRFVRLRSRAEVGRFLREAAECRMAS